MKHEESITKIIVLTGYILLIVLLLGGIVGVILQIHKLSKIGKDKDESGDLITVSYVLATLYKAESIGNAAYAPNAEIDYALFNKKDSLVDVVKNGISYLKQHADNEDFIQKLDTVEILLAQKAVNELKIIQLLDSIMKLPLQRRQVTTVLSQSELTNLTNVIKNRDTRLLDSTRLVTKTKTFGQKFGDLFRTHTTDSVLVKNMQKSDTVEDILPISFTLDTISQYVTDFMFQRSKKILQMTATLSARQLELQSTNEILFNKINVILRSLEEREFRTKEQFTQEQNKALLRSNRIGYFVALAAIAIAIIFIISTIRLINRQQNYRKKLEQSNEKIEKLLKSREWLLLSISHDIKAPISSILGYADLLDQKNNLFENEKEYILNLKNSSLQVLELVNNLINFHKIEQGKLSATISEMSPYNLVNEVFTSFKPIAQTKNLKFILKNDFSENLLCKSDFLFINNILNNLISNALKFTENGEIEICGNLKQSGSENELIFSVRDTGIGIAAEDLQKLFTEFERAQSSEIQHIEGSGLGLSISQRLTESIGGKISVNSTKGKGSTFTLSVPVNEFKIQKNFNQNLENKEIKHKNLLFIDDDILMLKICEKMAQQLNCTTYTVNNIDDVVKILNTNMIDIVFCDLKMPKESGFSFVETIRNTIKNPPLCVAISASEIYSEKELKENGFAGFLHKPFKISELDLIMNQLLNEKELSKEQQTENHIDFTPLINYAVGDKEASAMIMRTFITENVNIVHEIEQAISDGDNVLLQNLAHKILPRMQMINNQEIVKILGDLEHGKTETAKKQNLMQLIEKINAQAQEFIEKSLS